MSTNNGKVKVYKNPARSRPDAQKAYVPQYQLMGVEPEQYKSPLVPVTSGSPKISVAQTPQNEDNPRTRRPQIRQPYAEAVVSPIGRGRGPLPNVGNNIEQTWSSVDGEIVDDVSHLSVEKDHPMVDNNDFVSDEALGMSGAEFIPEVEDEGVNEILAEPPPPPKIVTEEEFKEALKNEYFSEILSQLAEGDYLLLVHGEALCSGPLDIIQEEARNLVFGEHKNYPDSPISVDDIVIIKKVTIKVGVFLE